MRLNWLPCTRPLLKGKNKTKQKQQQQRNTQVKQVDKVQDSTFLISYNRERKEIDKDLLSKPQIKKER